MEPVEYDGLAQDFSTRGKRLDEQIGLLRRFWTERSVTHEGPFDSIDGAGLAPADPAARPDLARRSVAGCVPTNGKAR
jgi:alkanesulfonate monooxygenase SsuD/methylene tetrahydromethanopterin reductase-like flavin-dependent oxidoreductase (luciferase family)